MVGFRDCSGGDVRTNPFKLSLGESTNGNNQPKKDKQSLHNAIPEPSLAIADHCRHHPANSSQHFEFTAVARAAALKMPKPLPCPIATRLALKMPSLSYTPLQLIWPDCKGSHPVMQQPLPSPNAITLTSQPT